MIKIQGYTARRSVAKEAMDILNGQTKISTKDINKVLKEKVKPDEFDKLVAELEKPAGTGLASGTVSQNSKMKPEAIIIFRDQVVAASKIEEKSKTQNPLIKRFVSSLKNIISKIV